MRQPVHTPTQPLPTKVLFDLDLNEREAYESLAKNSRAIHDRINLLLTLAMDIQEGSVMLDLEDHILDVLSVHIEMGLLRFEYLTGLGRCERSCRSHLLPRTGEIEKDTCAFLLATQGWEMVYEQICAGRPKATLDLNHSKQG